LSHAVARLGQEPRSRIVVAAQFEARSARDAERELAAMLNELNTSYIDVLTLYYVESQNEWDEITVPDGAWEYLAEQKRQGPLKLIGLTTHQRPLAICWAQTGKLDLLMIRYNAAHRGAERDVFPAAQARRIPVVTFTGLRWKALLAQTREDPQGFTPPSAVECYRFCLANTAVAVALMAPASRSELDQDLELLDDWRAQEDVVRENLVAHGERVRRTAGEFR
jgi:predicted aldo/keto reductase-like oxidoreductase